MSADTFMRRALALAERGRGLTSPNPMVGAVLVREGVVVGEGAHLFAGGPHAEVEALREAGDRARGATLYVTLEPCAHQGRTPPCTAALIAAGIARVVAAVGDPNPLVAGQGVGALRAAGVATEVGLLEVEAARQNRVFLTAMREHRPHVTLKTAMTADGRIADVHGVSRWITGEAARIEAHRLRSEADAVVVGATTALRDDPGLSVRLERAWPREPYRVVLDTHARTPPSARLIGAGSPERALIVVGDEAPEDRIRALRAAGATVLPVRLRGRHVDVTAVLAALFAQEVRGVLVEGGGETHASFLAAGVVDRVALFMAPLLLGGRGAPGVVGGEGRELKSAVRLQGAAVRAVGGDFLLEADVAREAR